MSGTDGRWDPPPFLSIGEQKYLHQKAEILKSIQLKSYLDLGNVLLDVQTKFRHDERTAEWFNTWLRQETFLTATQATKFIKVAKLARENHGLARLTKVYTAAVVEEVSRFPSKVRTELIKVLQERDDASLSEIRELRQQPVVQIEGLTEKADLLQNQAMEAAATSGIDSPTYRKLLDNYHRATDQLEALKQETATGDQKWGALVLSLRREARKARSDVENLSQDPDFYKQRIQGKLQVDIHKSMDGLTSALELLNNYKEDVDPKVLKRIMKDLEVLNEKITSTTAKTTAD